MKRLLYNKKYFVLTFVLALYSTILFATGNSYIKSEIKPISINDKGEILCRTRFTKNQMGAHRVMKVEYGFCIISKDTIVQFKTQEIEPDGFPDYKNLTKQINYWDSIFNSNFHKDHLSEIGHMIKDRYKFSLSNVNSFWVDKILTIQEFEKTKNVVLDNNPQKALFGALSTTYYDVRKIHLLYDFGDILILNNKNDGEKPETGADFDYFNPWTIEEGKVENIGYENSIVTGILILE